MSQFGRFNVPEPYNEDMVSFWFDNSAITLLAARRLGFWPKPVSVCDTGLKKFPVLLMARKSRLVTL